VKRENEREKRESNCRRQLPGTNQADEMKKEEMAFLERKL